MRQAAVVGSLVAAEAAEPQLLTAQQMAALVATAGTVALP
jgi:hypothetical protein